MEEDIKTTGPSDPVPLPFKGTDQERVFHPVRENGTANPADAASYKPKVEFSLQNRSSDFREREVAVEFIIKNLGTTTIEVLETSPRVPEGVRLSECQEFSLLATKAKHTKLCSELTHMGKDVLFVTDEAFRNRLTALYKVSLQKLLSDISGWYGLWQLYFRAFSGKLLSHFNAAQTREQALYITIESAKEAQEAWTMLVQPSAVDPAIKMVYRFKADKLAALEAELGLNSAIVMVPIATIEPGSFYSAIYVLRFPRNWLNASQFTVSVEATYCVAGRTERHNGSATTSIVISANPLILTLVAMVSSILGLALRHSFPVEGNEQIVDFLGSAQFLPPGEIIAAVILALLFFNMFKFTEFLKGLRRNLGWRSALMVGTLCGLGADRFFLALKALMGN